jgi:hypothetical protein
MPSGIIDVAFIDDTGNDLPFTHKGVYNGCPAAAVASACTSAHA